MPTMKSVQTAEGVLAQGAADTPFGGKFEHDFGAAVVTSVYGGASEILREIIAERRLCPVRDHSRVNQPNW